MWCGHEKCGHNKDPLYCVSTGGVVLLIVLCECALSEVGVAGGSH